MTDRVLIVWDEGLAERQLETDDLAEVLRRVDELDGRDRTLVTVYRGEAHAAVGGSEATGLVLYVTFDGSSFLQLKSDRSSADDEVTVTAGGQASRYPRRLVVNPAAAKAALVSFVEHGSLDPDQSWEPS